MGSAPQQRPRPQHRSGAIQVGRLAGVPVRIQPLWVLVVGLITWTLGAAYFPDADPSTSGAAAYALGLASALLIFAGVLAHELGHAVVARRNGVGVEAVDLWLLGGLAHLSSEPPDARSELRFAIAGPLVTLVLTVALAIVRLAVGDAGPAWLHAFLDYQLYVNAVILGFNLIPAFPLDGGRVLRALLWQRSGDEVRATRRAAGIGRVFGWGLVVLGFFGIAGGAPAGIWTMLVGGFLVIAAAGETAHLQRSHRLAGHRVADAMASPAVAVRAGDDVQHAVREAFAEHLHRAFPVVDERGHAIGLLTVAQVRRIPAAERSRLTVAEVADRDRALLIGADGPLAELAGSPAFQRTGRAVVVRADGTLEGIVTRDDIEELLIADELLAASAV